MNSDSTTAATRKLNIAEARDSLADIVNEVAYGGQRMVVMRRGRDLAAIVPITDLETLQSIPVAMPAWTQVQQTGAAYTFTAPQVGAENPAREDE